MPQDFPTFFRNLFLQIFPRRVTFDPPLNQKGQIVWLLILIAQNKCPAALKATQKTAALCKLFFFLNNQRKTEKMAFIEWEKMHILLFLQYIFPFLALCGTFWHYLALLGTCCYFFTLFNTFWNLLTHFGKFGHFWYFLTPCDAFWHF